MTINYRNFNEQFIEETHGRLYFYRKLYEGKHGEIFPRAQQLIDEGEIIDNILGKQKDVPFVQTPYIVANVSKLIVDVPAILVSRSIGKIDTSLPVDQVQIAASNDETDNAIEGTDDNTFSGEILNLQQEYIKQIVDNSKLRSKHRMNIVQHQLDGGLVGVPWSGDRGLRIEFKGRDVYFPHEDDLGADCSYARTLNEIEYLHIYRERLMKQGEEAQPRPTDDPEMAEEIIKEAYKAPADGLRCTHTLIRLGKTGVVNDEPLSDEEASELLKMDLDELDRFYVGKKNIFIKYWANDETFMNPLGVSALQNQEGKQDEINWTLTRSAMIFERNGKPRLAINKELAAALQKQMIKLYGENARGKFDSRMLEVVSMDDKGKSIEIIQIDVSKIGDVQWVKDLLKLMLMETNTSEKAIDFYMSSDGGSAQSGIAKFYDLFISLMKAEQIQMEYIDFLKSLIRDCLWLANKDDAAVKVEEPEISINEMLPIQRKEVIDSNMALYDTDKPAQSLETTLRQLHPDASEDFINEELARIREENQPDDTNSLLNGRQTLQNFMDNPGSRPAPGVDEE